MILPDAAPGADMLPGDLLPKPSLTRSEGYRALFLSDLHLGARGSRAGMLLHFLKHVSAGSIYLVGDTFDMGRMRPLHWSGDHDRLMERLLQMRGHGTRVVRLPGNHDAGLTTGVAARISGWAVELGIGPRSLVHDAADGRRHLVTHGDICDSVLYRSTAVAHMGSTANWMLRSLSLGVARQATEFMHRTDMATARSRGMRHRLLTHAREAGFDGIVCGHLHVPGLDHMDGMTYANCGDWVRNCTAIAEKADGSFVLVDFAEGKVRQAATVPAVGPCRPQFQEQVA